MHALIDALSDSPPSRPRTNAPSNPPSSPPGAAPAWRQDGQLQSLGAGVARPQAAQPLPAAHWVARSDSLAADLGWNDWLHSDAALDLLAGNQALPGGLLASVYSGHQFGVWAGQLGDGRALLLGEADTPLGRLEVQLKGSGLTPFSRMGDGRAVLRSSVREFLCSEAMHALGVPTTRALALVGSPLPVRRETVETAAVVTRVAPSFLRFGHFEHFAHTQPDPALLRRLVDTTIALHCIASVQKLGGVAAFIDAEHALDPSWAKRIGVDLEDLLVSQPSYGEEALQIAESIVAKFTASKTLKDLLNA